MTVNELIEQLEQIRKSGYGNNVVILSQAKGETGGDCPTNKLKQIDVDTAMINLKDNYYLSTFGGLIDWPTRFPENEYSDPVEIVRLCNG